MLRTAASGALALALTAPAALAGESVKGEFEACNASGYCETMAAPFPSIMACMSLGQQVEAQWIGGHPGFAPRGGWRCAPLSDRKA